MTKMTIWENLGLQLMFAETNTAISPYEKMVLSNKDRTAIELIEKHLKLAKWGLELLIELREKKPGTSESLCEKAKAEHEYKMIEPVLPKDEGEKKEMFDNLITVCQHILDGTVSLEERTRLYDFGKKYIDYLSIERYERDIDAWP